MDSRGKCCIKCDKGEKEGEVLNHVGLRWRDDKEKKHPLKTILDYAIKFNLIFLFIILPV